MLAELPIGKFLAATAAGTAVPGGGSVAALSAATAAALVEMVANLTIGRKGFESVSEHLIEIAGRARALREKLSRAMDQDAKAYTRVLKALRLPKDTDTARRIRQEAVQEAFKEAATVPLGVARDALAILELAGTVISEGNPNAVTDGMVGALLARSAGLAALYNVRINLTSIRDEDFVQDLRTQAETMETDLINREQSTLAGLSL